MQPGIKKRPVHDKINCDVDNVYCDPKYQASQDVIYLDVSDHRVAKHQTSNKQDVDCVEHTGISHHRVPKHQSNHQNMHAKEMLLFCHFVPL